MKFLALTILASLFPVVSNASEAQIDSSGVKKIECQLSDVYLDIASKKIFDLEDSAAVSAIGNNRVRINMSESECEDSTTINMYVADFKALKKGEEVYVQMQHEGPDLKVSGAVSCKKIE
jgi:hypothetical protein